MTLFENLSFIEFYQTEKCHALIGWPMTNLGWEYYTEKNGAKTPTIPTSENISYFVAGGNNCCHPMNGKIFAKMQNWETSKTKSSSPSEGTRKQSKV